MFRSSKFFKVFFWVSSFTTSNQTSFKQQRCDLRIHQPWKQWNTGPHPSTQNALEEWDYQDTWSLLNGPPDTTALLGGKTNKHRTFVGGRSLNMKVCIRKHKLNGGFYDGFPAECWTPLKGSWSTSPADKPLDTHTHITLDKKSCRPEVERNKRHLSSATVDGRNPAPPGMVTTLYIMG